MTDALIAQIGNSAELLLPLRRGLGEFRQRFGLGDANAGGDCRPLPDLIAHGMGMGMGMGHEVSVIEAGQAEEGLVD